MMRAVVLLVLLTSGCAILEPRGRLAFTPGNDSEGRYYEFAGQGALDELLTGIIRPSSVVTPAGYDRPWTVEIHGLVRAS
jgi:hypothetical protein